MAGNSKKRKLDQGLDRRLGRNVAKLRKTLGWTQEDLAHRLGVEPETISRLERGTTLPSLKSLEKLAAIFGARIADLLEEPVPEVSEEAALIHAWIAALDADDKEYVMDCVRRLCIHLGKHT
jgi:transcriptional regulator with XRE-family HTH domain